MADFSDVAVETGNGALSISHASELTQPIQDARRVAFFQTDKSHHNPRDASLVVLLGAGLPSDGFGDSAITEAEDGNHNSAEPPRGHASGNGQFNHFTVDLLPGQTLAGQVDTNGHRGWALPFFRYSYDVVEPAFAEATFSGSTMSFQFDSTRTDLTKPDPGEAWDWFRTVYGDPIFVNSDVINYSVRMLNSHVEFDVAGILFIGANVTT